MKCNYGADNDCVECRALCPQSGVGNALKHPMGICSRLVPKRLTFALISLTSRERRERMLISIFHKNPHFPRIDSMYEKPEQKENANPSGRRQRGRAGNSGLQTRRAYALLRTRLRRRAALSPVGIFRPLYHRQLLA